MNELWQRTTGDPAVCVGLLDGCVELKHKCFEGASLRAVNLGGYPAKVGSFSNSHGTGIASIIFGQHNGSVSGIVPRCKGLVGNIFDLNRQGDGPSCSEEELAYSIRQMAERGA